MKILCATSFLRVLVVQKIKMYNSIGAAQVCDATGAQ